MRDEGVLTYIFLGMGVALVLNYLFGWWGHEDKTDFAFKYDKEVRQIIVSMVKRECINE